MTNWLYSNSPDNKNRYTLGKSGNNPLIVIGVNPSTAEPENLDPTLRQVKSRALSMGYDSWIMINIRKILRKLRNIFLQTAISGLHGEH